MTQQPFYQQPAPQQHQQPVPQQQYAPQPQPAYAPQFPGQPQQGYGQPPAGYGQAPQQPQVPLASGSLDDFYNQPSAGGGPAISWSVNGMPKPEGTTYVGIVARDVQASDIQQQTDPKSGQPKFYRDGRPQFVMKVPLKLHASPEFPEGEGVLFVRGQMRDELVRAMTESGAGRDPKGGDAIQVTLVQRKPSRGGGMPMNVFQIRYQPANPVAQPAPVQQAAPAPQPAQPVQQGVDFAQLQPQAQQPVQAQQAPQFQAPAQVPAQPQVPQQQFAPQQPAAQAVQPVQPVQQGAPQPPANLDEAQQALIAQLTNRQG